MMFSDGQYSTVISFKMRKKSMSTKVAEMDACRPQNIFALKPSQRVPWSPSFCFLSHLQIASDHI